MQIAAAAPDVFARVQHPWIEGVKNPCYRDADGHARCLPFMSIIGVSKCGTTDLYKKLLSLQCAPISPDCICFCSVVHCMTFRLVVWLHRVRCEPMLAEWSIAAASDGVLTTLQLCLAWNEPSPQSAPRSSRYNRGTCGAHCLTHKTILA